MNEEQITKRNLIMFPLGTVGRDMMYNLVTSYLLTFVLFTHKLTATQLSAITAIMVAARIFDALNDPVMGNIIERTRTRWGKFKPWLVIGILTTSVVIYLAFNVQLQGWTFVWFFGLIYFLYSITYTMHDIAYWGMVPALSSDADTRNKYTSRATLFAGIGGMLAAAFIPMLTAGDAAIGGNAVTAYGRVALLIAILGPAFLAFTVFGVVEQRNYDNEPAPPVSFKKIIGTITGNDQLLWIALIFLLQQIGNGIVLSGIGQTYIYVDFGYNGIFFTAFQMLGMMVTGLLMIFYPVISRRLHRKKLMSILMVISAIGYVVMLLPGLVMQSGNLKFILLTLGYMLANFGQYGFYLDHEHGGVQRVQARNQRRRNCLLAAAIPDEAGLRADGRDREHHLYRLRHYPVYQRHCGSGAGGERGPDHGGAERRPDYRAADRRAARTEPRPAAGDDGGPLPADVYLLPSLSEALYSGRSGIRPHLPGNQKPENFEL